MNPVKGRISPLKNNVLVEEMNFDERVLNSGIILKSDNGRDHGIRPRWGRVYSVGKDQIDVSVGDYVLVDHARWTRGIDIDDQSVRTIRMIDVKDILLVSDEPVNDGYVGKL